MNKLAKKLNDDQVLNLLDIAQDSSTKSKRLLLNSQSSVNKKHCVNYASSQLTQLNKMAKNKETMSNVESLSPYIIKECMINMTDRMATTNMVTKSTPTDTSQNTTSNKEVNACDNANDTAVVGAYLKCNFILPKERTTYSLYSLGLFLTRHHDTIIDGVKISRSKIIDYLMSMGLIPVKKTTAYKTKLKVL